MEPNYQLEARNISFGYNNGLLLKNLSFSVGPGELIALIGPNGSGKTTLLKILLGLLTPTSGSITLKGQPLSTLEAKVRAKIIAYVCQQPALSFPLTVRELVALGRYPHGGRVRESPADTLAIASAGMTVLAPSPVNPLQIPLMSNDGRAQIRSSVV